MKVLEIISERVFKAGYVLRKERIENPCKGEPPMVWTMAYSVDGGYIGRSLEANRLCVQRGIRPQVINAGHTVCSIGFSSKDGKWYGWSHRAIYGFKIGSKCKDGHCHYVPKSEGGKGEWTAKTVADAKQMAIDFAEGAS